VSIEFLQKIVNRGHKVSVLISEKHSKIDNVPDGINLYFVPSWHIISELTGNPYPIFKDIKPYFQMIKPDVVHINSHLFICNYQAIKIAHQMRIPVVLTVHGFTVKRNRALNYYQSFYLHTFARSIFKLSNSIICLNKNDSSQVGKILGKNKAEIVANGVDSELFRPLEKVQYSITWLGRFVPEKGLIYLLNGMLKVLEKRDDVNLLLIGDGILKNECVQFVEKNKLEKNISFIDSLTRDQIAQKLGSSSIFIFPSLKEGMPLALLEAMSSGNSVIASDIPGVNEIVTNGYDGILVETKNSQAIADQILALLNDNSLRNKLSKNARNTIKERYAIEQMLTKLENIYSTCLSEDYLIKNENKV
jgi:glycosyltransferase involved in cell wall biosynthesis